MSIPSRIAIPTITVAVLAGGALGYTLYQQHLATAPQPTVAAGMPLPPTSTSHIAVLPGQDGLAGTELTNSAQPLPSTTSITLTPTEATPKPQGPAAFDPNAARLGTTLSLLVNAWPNGGPLPRQLASAAAQLAAQTGQPALVNAANALRSVTPREGPLTLQVLLLETSAVVTLAPPENLPQDDATAEAQKSWFRVQLEKLVQISSTPATQNRWVTAILSVQQQLVRGAVNDARAALESAPLEGDPRLEPLRHLVADYLGQTAKLNNLVTTYTNAYLTPEQE